MYDEKTDKCVYHEGDHLAITIAPDDKIQHFLQVTRVEAFLKYYESKFQLLDAKNFDHWFRVEISEPIGEIKTEGPRLHLHGIIVLKTKLSVYKFLLNIMPDLLQHARLEIRHLTAESYDGWKEYCVKQRFYLPKNFWYSNISGSPLGETFGLSPARRATSLPHSSLEDRGTGGGLEGDQ